VGVHDHGYCTNRDHFGNGIVSIIHDEVDRTSLLDDQEADNCDERYIFAKFQESLIPNMPATPTVKTIPTYLTLFIFGFLYQLVLVYDSLRLKNTIQVIGVAMYNFGMLIYASIQYDQINKAIEVLTSQTYVKPNTTVWSDVQPYLLAVPCIIAFFSAVLCGIAWKLYDEFAWTIYKRISADLRMKRRFLAFQVRHGIAR